MFEYWICSNADKNIFDKQCQAIENKFDTLIKLKLEENVFGTLCQIYFFENKKIEVFCDETLDDVHIFSEVDLDKFFN